MAVRDGAGRVGVGEQPVEEGRHALAHRHQRLQTYKLALVFTVRVLSDKMPHRVGFENCFPSDSLPCLGILFGRPLAAAAVGMATKRWQIIWNLLAICTDSGRVPLSALMRFHVPGFESWFFCF